MGDNGATITGSDILAGGGATALYYLRQVKPE